MASTPAFGEAMVLRVLAGPSAGVEVEIATGQPLLIGRSEGCGLCLPGMGVSRIHARLTRDAGCLDIERISTVNSVFVNGVPCSKQRLGLWDMIGIGPHVLRVEFLHGMRVSNGRRDVDTDASVLSCLLEIQRLLASDAEDVVRESLELLLLALPATRLSLFSIESDGAVRQGHTVARGASSPAHMSHGFVRHVLDAGRAVLLSERIATGGNSWEQTLREQNVQAVAGVPVRHGDRIAAVLLCDNLDRPDAIDHTHLRVLSAVAQSLEHVFEAQELQRMRADRIRAEVQFENAQAVQRSVLGRDISAITGPWAFRAVYRPALELGGDYLDHAVDASGLSLILADVSGKGVGAGIVVGMLRIAYKDAQSQGLPPAELLKQMESRLQGELPPGMFYTALAVHLARDGLLRWAGMGHPDGLVMRGGSVVGRLASVPGMFGLLSPAANRAEATAREMHLQPGDRIFLCTDGLTEAYDDTGCMFGMERIQTALAEQAQAGPGAALNGVLAELARHVGAAEQSDDIALLTGDYLP